MSRQGVSEVGGLTEVIFSLWVAIKGQQTKNCIIQYILVPVYL